MWDLGSCSTNFALLHHCTFQLNQIFYWVYYELKHKAIQRKTNRLGYTALIINTSIAANDLLRIYIGKTHTFILSSIAFV